MIDQVLHEVVSRLPGYERRPQQLDMARIIDGAIRAGRHAILEAGTGSGKSFGYLIPLLESGKKAVISTGTIALQEQLLQKDIPFLQQAYKKELKVAVAKGRSNYVCLRKLREADHSLGALDPLHGQVEQLIQIAFPGGGRGGSRWDGDRGSLPFLVDRRLWLDELASDHEDCLASKCPNYLQTPHRLARIACDDADLVIANHALYFTDLITGAGVLPRHDLVVFDEAHHLERAAIQSLTIQVGRWAGTKLLQRVRRRFRDLPLEFAERIDRAEAHVKDLLYPRGRGQFPIRPGEGLEELAAGVAQELAQLSAWIARADLQQLTMLDDEPHSQVARQRAEIVREQLKATADGLMHRWRCFAAIGSGPSADASETHANWMELDPSRDYFELKSAPLEVGKALRSALWTKRTCVLTSATLAVDGGFEYLKRELGIDAADEAVLGSPFDFRQQAVLYVPRGLPLPASPGFMEAVPPVIERILHATSGRAFVLFTSYRMLREVAAQLAGRLPYPSKTQEDLPRARLIEWFKSTPHSVLFATSTFWEGVDVPGDALSCVIIDKLPFASPDDPVVAARTERMKARGEDWFSDFMLPKAILTLKQGFGRLIRTRTDTGLVAILDRRLVTRGYGPTILRSLPPARRIDRLEAVGPLLAPDERDTAVEQPKTLLWNSRATSSPGCTPSKT
jgi:ATP-dependent DNA helicase DinG